MDEMTLRKDRITQAAVRRLLVTDSDVLSEAERIVTNTLVNSNRNANGCYTTSDIAKTIGIDAKDLNSFLVDMGIQIWKRGQFHLTEHYEGRDLTEERLFIYYSKSGKQKRHTYLVWTQKGADFINSLL